MRFTAQGFSARFWALIGATFLGFLGIGTVLPALAPHIRHHLGGSDETVGFVIGSFSFVALGSRFFSGPLADRRGRKIAFLAGLLSCALAGAAYLAPLGIAGMYLGRSLQGFGEACLYTGAAAWAVEASGIHRSAQALGYLSSGIWGGISAGPLVGQWLGTFERAAAMQMITALIAFAVLMRVPEDYRPEAHSGRRPWIPSSLIAPGIAIGFVNVHYPVVVGFLILHLARHGNSGPAAFSAYAGVILLSRFFLGGLPDRIDRDRPRPTARGRDRRRSAARIRILFPLVVGRCHRSQAYARAGTRLDSWYSQRLLRSVRGPEFVCRWRCIESLWVPGVICHGCRRRRSGGDRGPVCIRRPEY
jgi:MFS family permease